MHRSTQAALIRASIPLGDSPVKRFYERERFCLRGSCNIDALAKQIGKSEEFLWAERVLNLGSIDPAALANNVKRLKGQDGLVRLRVGDWRVVMRDESVLQVLYVTSRGSTYRE